MNKENKEAKPAPAKSGKTAKIAVVRIRGPATMDHGMEYTLRMLRLHRKNTCVVLDKTPSTIGMIKKVKDFITWGEIDDSTIKEMTSKRGQKTKIDGKEALKPFFRLNPPKGGFERKGIKVPFSVGGALGYRREGINDLIRRML